MFIQEALCCFHEKVCKCEFIIKAAGAFFSAPIKMIISVDKSINTLVSGMFKPS